MPVRLTDVNESLLLRTPIGSEAEGGAMHPDDAKLGKNNIKLGWQILGHFGHIEPKRANLPTPMVSDAYNDNMVSTQHVEGTMHSVSLAQLMQRDDLAPKIVKLFPTVRAVQGDTRNSNVWLRNPTEPQNLENAIATLFPTPLSRDHKDGSAERVRNGKIQTDSLALALFSSGEVEVSTVVQWGKFEPAIRRWEECVGRQAPQPTFSDGKNDKHRLSSKFTEWMMGLPEGWITGAGLKRAEELKACGNGVVPQQAYLALQILVGDKGEIFEQ